MKIQQQLATGLLALALLPTLAWAKPQLQVEMQAEREIVVIENGEQVKKREATSEATPGTELFFTFRYANTGDEEATNAVIDNPVPDNTAYIPDSAFGDGTEILFSIDRGRTYKKPSQLTYEVTLENGRKERRTANPEQYTHIRWIIESIRPGTNGTVGFQVLVK